MKRAFILIMILAPVLSTAGLCLDGLRVQPVSAVSQDMPVLQQAANVALHPAVTLSLALIGMMLLVSELMTDGDWTINGALSLLCLAVVFAAPILAGLALWAGVALLLSGIALIVVEARVLRGYAVSGLAGLACESAGLYLMFAGAGVVYAATMSVLMAVATMIAFLAYVSRNEEWRKLSRRVVIAANQGHSAVSGEGRIEITSLSPSTDATTEKPVSTYPSTDVEQSKQQTIGTGQDEAGDQ